MAYLWKPGLTDEGHESLHILSLSFLLFLLCTSWSAVCTCGFSVGDVLQVSTPLTFFLISDTHLIRAAWKLPGCPAQLKGPSFHKWWWHSICGERIFFYHSWASPVILTGDLTHSRHSLNVEWPFSLLPHSSIPGPSRELCVTCPVVWLLPLSAV